MLRCKRLIKGFAGQAELQALLAYRELGKAMLGRSWPAEVRCLVCSAASSAESRTAHTSDQHCHLREVLNIRTPGGEAHC